MKKTLFNPFLAAWLAFVALTAMPLGRAQTEPTPAEPAVAPSPVVTEKAKPAAPATEVAPAAVVEIPAAVETKTVETKATEEKAPELRELGTEPTPAPEPVEKPVVSKKSKRGSRNSDSRQEGPPLGNHHISAGAKRGEAVSVFGSTTVDGEVTQAVSIMGNTTVNGTVTDEVVTVMGNTTINGKAHDVVTVMGDVILGPQAVVTGDITLTMGKLKKAEGAQFLGDLHEVTGFGNMQGNGGFEGLHAWFTECLLRGRPLGFGEHLGWIWVVAGAFVVFYMLLALIFPRGVVRCAEALEQKPGATILAAFLTVIITPVTFVLLAITGIGLVLIPFIIIALVFGSLFGMSAMLAWFGRRVLGTGESGVVGMPVCAVLVGGVIVSLLYLIPYLGFIVWKLFGLLGLGMVVYALIQASKRNKPAPVPRAAAAATAFPAGHAQPMSQGFTSGATTTAAAAGAMPTMEQTMPPLQSAFVPPVLPVISAVTLPRVGFWLRFAAALLDAVLVGVMCGLLSSVFDNFGSGFLFWYALYCVVMWATKGTTVGGVVCGLKVVRLDDRPLDWGVCVVRALGGFLSLCVAGLGFIWVAFDDEKQSWHDKIAGTTIVRVPKGTPLI